MEDGDVKPETKPTEAGAAPAAAAPAADAAEEAEPEAKGFTIDEAIKQTLRKALYTNTLYRGLREACKVLDARQALFCFLAKNCDQADYVKVVEGLCKEHNTHLVRVADKIQLGEWAGLCTYDKEGAAHKVVGASCVVIHQNVAKENDAAVAWLINYCKTEGGAK